MSYHGKCYRWKEFVQTHPHLFPKEELLKTLTVEDRIKGLPVEERLKGVPPEEFLKRLPVEEIQAFLKKIEKTTNQRTSPFGSKGRFFYTSIFKEDFQFLGDPPSRAGSPVTLLLWLSPGQSAKSPNHLLSAPNTSNIVAIRLIGVVDEAIVEVHAPREGRVIGVRRRRPIIRGVSVRKSRCINSWIYF